MTADNLKNIDKTVKGINKLTLFQRIWNDPVLSQVISTLFIVGITFLYSVFRTSTKDLELGQIFLSIITYPIAFYQLVIILISLTTIYIIIVKVKRLRRGKNLKLILNERIGEYNFAELYNALILHTVPNPPSLVTIGFNEANLITYFTLYQRKFNMGVGWNDGGDQGNHMYYTIGPLLISYGLLERARPSDNTDPLNKDIIQTSEKGYRFLQLLSLWRLYNKEKLSDW